MRGLLPDVDLIKIDIEGYEYQVLAPVRAELAASTPVLFVEVLDHAVELRGLLADLVDEGTYGIWAITRSRAVPMRATVLRARGVRSVYDTRDVILAAPRQAAALGLEPYAR